VLSYTGAGAPKSIGSVSFRDGSTVLATVPVDANGRASFSTSSLSVGIHTITATYSNGTNFSTGSGTATITIAR